MKAVELITGIQSAKDDDPADPTEQLAHPGSMLRPTTSNVTLKEMTGYGENVLFILYSQV